MTPVMRRGRARVTTLAATGAVLLMALAGCAPSVEDQEARAAAVFDELVSAASSEGTDALRTVQVGEIEERACGDDTDDVATVRTATATPPVTASEDDLAATSERIFAQLDPELWTPIEPTAGIDQSAAQDSDGTVATITVDWRIIVIAVFTPCRTP